MRPTSLKPNRQKPYNLAPAARGRYKPGARRREEHNCGARLSNALGGNGHRRSSVASA